MDSLELSESKLLLVAARLPPLERSVMKELVLRQDVELTEALDAYYVQRDAQRFKQSVLRRVVDEIVTIGKTHYDEVFAEYSTDVAKKISKNERATLTRPTRAPRREGKDAEPEKDQDQDQDREEEEEEEEEEEQQQQQKQQQPKGRVVEDSSLVYGEINLYSFATILSKTQPQPGEVFVDLGHGTGRAVIGTALLYGHELGQVRGIELMDGLFRVSEEAVERYNSIMQSESLLYGTDTRADVIVEQGDLTAATTESGFDWTTADIVFANSTCFTQDLMARMATKAERMAPGSRFITFTKALPSDKFRLLERKLYTMSWGGATSFIHVRKADEEVGDGEDAVDDEN